MGLDMYAYRMKSDAPENHEEIAYWRKHHDLHGLMCQIWLRSNPDMTEIDFNGVKLPMTEEILDEVEAAIRTRSMPKTTGFFFGNFPPTNETDLYDLHFVTEARQALSEGYEVYYDSWW